MQTAVSAVLDTGCAFLYYMSFVMGLANHRMDTSVHDKVVLILGMHGQTQEFIKTSQIDVTAILFYAYISRFPEF